MNPLLEQNGPLLVDADHPMPSPNLEEMFVKYVTNTPRDVLGNNVELSLERNLPRFFGETVRQGIGPDGDACWKVKWAPHPIAIIAGGPSLRKTISKVKDFKTVMVAGSSHDYVVEHGIVPDYCVLLDGIPEAIDWLKNPQQTTTYLVASQNDPTMFDYLEGYNVRLWHAMGLEHEYGDEPTIGGGSTTTLRCLEIAFLMGYWDQHFFGLDSCYAEDGTTHAYDDWANPQLVSIKVQNGNDTERVFKTDTGLVGQAEVFIKTFKERKKFMRATIHGDGLIAETVRTDYGSEGIRVAC